MQLKQGQVRWQCPYQLGGDLRNQAKAQSNGLAVFHWGEGEGGWAVELLDTVSEGG